MTPLLHHFSRMAAYNQWANETLLSAAQALPDAALWEDKGAFFGSILGTFNHILVGDLVWFSRMTGNEYPWFQGLDQVLYRDMKDFIAARRVCDRMIIDTVPILPDDGILSYHNSRGEPQDKPWPVILGHVFNHQTHHRGQIHTLIGQLGGTPPAIDYLYFPGG